MSLTKVSYSMINGSPANVLDYGAIGDGVADDTVAIQTAVNASIASGGSLYMPTGTYKCTSTITISGADLHLYGDGESTLLSFASSTDVICLDFTNGDRCTFENFSVYGIAGTTDGLVFGSTSAASANVMSHINLRNHRYGIYSITGVTNRFFACETSRCDIGINLTAQSNVCSFIGHYFLQNKQYFSITNSNATFVESTFQVLLNSTEAYGFQVTNSEVVFSGCYFEKEDAAIKLGLVSDLTTGDILATSLIWNGGHITPDGNSVIEYSGSPVIQINGVNNSFNAGVDTNGIVISRVNANDYVLYGPSFNPSATKTGRIIPKLISEFNYGIDGDNAAVVTPQSGYVTVDGTFFIQTGLTQNKYYTLALVVRHPTDVRSSNGLHFEQLESSVRVERRELANLPTLSDSWQVVYIPFRARGDEIQLETINSELFHVKFVRLYEGTTFQPIDATATQEQVWTAIPTIGAWQQGDRIWKSNVSASGIPGWVCTASGTPGTWKAMAAVAA